MLNLFDWSVVYKDFWELLKYLPITMELTVVCMVFGLILGFLLAVIRIRRIPVLKRIVDFFISIIRGTPIIVQLYITYFGIPIALKYINYYNGTDFTVARIPAVIYAIVALSLNQSAYNAVTIQAALEAVNKGEIEAATSLGMSGKQRMFRIIIPEAIELALPSLGNTLIGLIKGTSLAFSCSVIEMTAAGKILAGNDYRYFEVYVALAVIYWLLTIVVEYAIQWIINFVTVPDSPGERKRMFGVGRKMEKRGVTV